MGGVLLAPVHVLGTGPRRTQRTCTESAGKGKHACSAFKICTVSLAARKSATTKCNGARHASTRSCGCECVWKEK